MSEVQLVALLREAVALMPLGTAKRAEWMIRTVEALPTPHPIIPDRRD